MTPTSTPLTRIDLLFEAVFTVSLDFRIELTYDAACRFIERIDRYNEFDAGCVLAALSQVDRMIPRRSVGDGNPTDGQRTYSIAVGRECSPVIYLDRFEWHATDRLPDEHYAHVCREMTRTGRADEATYEIEPFAIGEGRRVTFRFWWD
jgi:hypothetical protein